jgi:hypothetical protein
MSLTFGQAKKILAQYQGKGGKRPTAENLDQFVIKVLQYLLYQGSPNAERAFELYAVNGWFTAPYELETPLKVKINGRVGTVQSKWFEFKSGNDFTKGSCYENTSIFEDANTYYTAYDLPSSGAHVGVIGTTHEEADTYLIVQGSDLTGREIFTNHKGADISGELVEIRKNVLVRTNVVFGNITGIVKTRTNGYVQLHWTDREGHVKGFLSDYSPIEETPSYRRFQLRVSDCPSLAKITVLGRTRIKTAYADNDRIPFDNLLAIEVAGQTINANYNTDIQRAQQQHTFLKDIVNQEAVHKRPSNGNPLEVFHATSAGTIKGIV